MWKMSVFLSRGTLKEGPEGRGEGGGGYYTHFPANMVSKSHFPVLKSHSHKQNSDKNIPSVIHTSSFLFASAKQWLLNVTNKDPKVYEDLRRCSEEDMNLLNCIKTCK